MKVSNDELNEEAEAPTIVNSINIRGRVVDSDMVQMRGEIYVDNDNTPAPENILSKDSTALDGEEYRGRDNSVIFTTWDHDGFCQQ